MLDRRARFKRAAEERNMNIMTGTSFYLNDVAPLLNHFRSRLAEVV